MLRPIRVALALASLLAFTQAPAAQAGGAIARVLAPSTSDGVYVVETLNCGERQSFGVSAFAEGRVEGRLQSIPLRLDRGEGPGLLVLRRQWPVDGTWVVRIVPAVRGGATSVTPIGHDGRPGEAKLVFGGDGRREARATLALR